jgi:mannose-6-phosphate isomerase-like protein (cupin superfamily)
MKITMRTVAGALILALVGPGAAAAEETQEAEKTPYEISPKGLGTYANPSGSFILKRLVDSANFGGNEIDVAELTFGPEYQGRVHTHAPIEIFYVLSGRLRHVVNGVAADLEPGMIGVVRPGDEVEHIVLSKEPLRTLVIWLPGGLAERLAGNLQPLVKPKD